ERLVARGGQQQTTRTVRRSTYDPHVVDLTSRLSNRLETPVRIDVGKRKGRITLEFTNLDDLERLVENIGLDLSLPSGDDRSDGCSRLDVIEGDSLRRVPFVLLAPDPRTAVPARRRGRILTDTQDASARSVR